MSIPLPTPPTDWPQVRAWRKLTRELLLARRAALAPGERHAIAERVRDRLLQTVDLRRWPVLGFCWPIRGEIDVRRIAERHIAGGGQAALPVIVEKGAPVEFWRWHPGIGMTTGMWNIPVPAVREPLAPDAVLVPLVGFDAARYRLGYGGGYFDRTLASLARRPFAVGLGYADSALATIYPQAHDIPMDLIVTDQAA